MGDYLGMILEDEAAHASSDPDAMATLLDERAAFVDALRHEGKLKDAGRFRPSREGKRVRRVRGETRVEGGPFTEEGRALGSYCWFEAASVEEAASVAAKCPTLAPDRIDVRPLMKGQTDAAKQDKPGKIFGFAVLGNAVSEEAWVTIMDRIDAESRETFPSSGTLGGARLMPPRTGRSVVSEGGRRAVYDGPFLESKEVIGGVFFIRMVSLDEAVRWASSTPFVDHGALEIRELWRS